MGANWDNESTEIMSCLVKNNSKLWQYLEKNNFEHKNDAASRKQLQIQRRFFNIFGEKTLRRGPGGCPERPETAPLETSKTCKHAGGDALHASPEEILSGWRSDTPLAAK